MAKKQYNVTPEQFVQAWQTSESAQEVADRLGMPKAIVLARASTYRQQGINLKKMKKKHKRALDVPALNRLIEGKEEIDFVHLCREAIQKGADYVTVARPAVLGETHDEVMTNLEVLANFGLLLRIRP